MIRTMIPAVVAAILIVPIPQAHAQAASPNAPDPTLKEGTSSSNREAVAPPVVAPVQVQAVQVIAPNSRPAVANGAVNDSLFAIVAANSGMFELAISELGRQKAADPELKRFSEQMIQDHTRLNRELTTLAAQKRMALPTQVDSCGQFSSESLAGLSGKEFDRCYAKAQFIAHMAAIAVFEAQSQRGMDPDVKALAARALPILKGHLKAIKPIAMKYHEKEQDSSPAHTQAE